MEDPVLALVMHSHSLGEVPWKAGAGVPAVPCGSYMMLAESQNPDEGHLSKIEIATSALQDSC